MNANAVKFLKNEIAEAESVNRSIGEWEGKWTEDIHGFLNHWLGDDVEEERGERTYEQFAADFMDELKEWRRKNLVRICVAKNWLEGGEMPPEMNSRWTAWLVFEMAVNAMCQSVKQ